MRLSLASNIVVWRKIHAAIAMWCLSAIILVAIVATHFFLVKLYHSEEVESINVELAQTDRSSKKKHRVCHPNRNVRHQPTSTSSFDAECCTIVQLDESNVPSSSRV